MTTNHLACDKLMLEHCTVWDKRVIQPSLSLWFYAVLLMTVLHFHSKALTHTNTFEKNTTLKPNILHANKNNPVTGILCYDRN